MLSKLKQHTTLTVMLGLGLNFGLGVAGSASADVIFSQDFTSSETVSDYVDQGGDGTSTLFGDITEDGTTSVSISNDQLLYSTEADTAQTPAGLGTFVQDNFGATPLASARFEVSLTNPGNTSNNNPRALLQLLRNQAGAVKDEIRFFYKNGTIQVQVNGNGAVTTLDTDGDASASITIYENSSNAAEEFTAVDGNTYTIDPNRFYFFVNDQLIDNNLASSSADDLVGIGFIMNSRITANTATNLDDGTFSFDTIEVRGDLNIGAAPVPEPASLSLIAIGACLIAGRRRRA